MCDICNFTNHPETQHNSDAPWTASFWHVRESTRYNQIASRVEICGNGPHSLPNFQSDDVTDLLRELTLIEEDHGNSLVMDQFGTVPQKQILLYIVATSDPKEAASPEARKTHVVLLHRQDEDPQKLMDVHRQIVTMEMDLAGELPS